MTRNDLFPPYENIEKALLYLIYVNGGELHSSETYEPLSNYFKLSNEAKEITRSNYFGGEPHNQLAWHCLVQWGRSDLKKAGYLEPNAPRGLWKLNKAGISAAERLSLNNRADLSFKKIVTDNKEIEVSKSKPVIPVAFENVFDELREYKSTYADIGLDNTTKESIIYSRIGQGGFRTVLIEYWHGCSVTGCEIVEILVASHIKPWRCSNNKERLDVFNGLLLIPNLDKLFDKGLVTFKDDGQIIFSERINDNSRATLGLSDSFKLRTIRSEHIPYLQYHREFIFS